MVQLIAVETRNMSGLTNYLKKVGKQDDLLGGPRSVGPVAEQRP